MTKVLRGKVALRVWAFWLGACACAAVCAAADSAPQKPGVALYLQLGQVGLDATRVYQVRGASLARPAMQISLDDGTIAFTKDVMGRVTGAFFEGEGEILLTPTDEVERRSMSLFTGMAILEERFATAYFRFNDDVASELKPDLRAPSDAQEFVGRWDATARNLAGGDAMRLLMTFSRMLPALDVPGSDPAKEPGQTDRLKDRFLHARLQGTKLGVFDAYYDSTATEQVQAGQVKTIEGGESFYNVWTSFAPTQGTPTQSGEAKQEGQRERRNDRRPAIHRYTITTEVLPPKQIHARARLECEARNDGERTLLFELSRYLQVESVSLDGREVEFIHNPALEGTQLSRRGNDLVAVVLPEVLRAGRSFVLEFAYGGEVLAEAGGGLLYVGARGTWYPNRGMGMADFDLQFSYPQGWTLLATGKPAQVSAERSRKNPGDQISRWVSERRIPLAGFNLGKYREVTTRAGNVEVETYATQGVEKDFPSAPIQVIQAPMPATPLDPTQSRRAEVIVPDRPSPAKNEMRVGEAAAQAIQYFADRFGPFPYSHLALTQMPGRESQGWPGLVFLSSYAFLNQQEREQLHFEPYRILEEESIPAHEVAHQWWGDTVSWVGYRDQWFTEGLATYCSLMMVQERNPAAFREVMETYRKELVQKNKDGRTPMDAGPVTLGTRLLSSEFPEGYEAISYGRGAWLFHMLRTMLKDGAAEEGRKVQSYEGSEEPFTRALRKLRQRYEGQAISTRELLEVFAEDLPPALRYEGKKSLDWFLDGWINGTSLPQFELKSVKITPKGTSAIVSGTILQKNGGPDLVTSIPVYAAMAGKQFVLLGRVFADGEESSFRLTAPAGTHKVVLDPYETILTSPK